MLKRIIFNIYIFVLIIIFNSLLVLFIFLGNNFSNNSLHNTSTEQIKNSILILFIRYIINLIIEDSSKTKNKIKEIKDIIMIQLKNK